MKWMKRISIWIAISLSLQCLALFYLEYYFLATDSKVVTKKVDEDKSEKVKNIDIIVPPNSENILVSYDAKYLSYYENENEKLKIVNAKDGSIKDIDIDKGTTISFYKWLPDRNRMLLVEKESGGKLGLYYYDVAKSQKEKVKSLTWSNERTEIQDIQLSTLTGVIYVKAINRGAKSGIYRIDRMATMTKVDTIPSFVSNIGLVRLEDKLVYEGLVYNSIYVTGNDKAIRIEGVEKLTLIGTDNDGNVYLGELKDKLIGKIYYGKTSEKTEEWKMINLQVSSEKKDLFVSTVGKVYQNDSLRGVIKEVSSGTQSSYQGKLLQLYTNGIVSLVNNKIAFASFK